LLRAAARGGKFSFLRLWRHWEPIEMRLWRVRHVRPGSVLQFGISPYRGPTTVLADGTAVPRGSRILHLHLDNARVASAIGSSGGNLWALAHLLNGDLDALAEDFVSGRLVDVIAVRGVTVLAPTARRLGFEARPLPRNFRWALIHSLAGLVIASYHQGGVSEVEHGVPWPGEIWMSAATLRRRIDRAEQAVASNAVSPPGGSRLAP
jgi:hypothetical protein